MAQASQRMKLESGRQQRDAGRLAYQRWLKSKQDEDVLRKKERVYMNEVQRLQEESKIEEKRRAQERYKAWRVQKDFESKLQRKNEKDIANILSNPFRGRLIIILYSCISRKPLQIAALKLLEVLAMGPN